MAQDAAVCEHCGAAVSASMQFCRSCGRATSAASAARAASQRTMVGVPVMHGVSGKPKPAGGDRAGPAAEDQAARDARQALNRTIVGVGAPDLPPSVMPSSAVPSAARPVQSGASHPADSDPDLGQTRPTQDGTVETLGGDDVPIGPRPTLGDVDDADAYEAESHPGKERPRTHYDSDHDWDARPSAASRPSVGDGRRSRGGRGGESRRWAPSIASLLVATLGLLTAGALGFVALRGRGPDVQVRVESGMDGEWLLFEVPGVPPGAKLRFGGQEQALEAGRTRFALGSDSLRIGKNAVLFDVVYPGGKIEDGKVTIMVDYRVTLDTAPLRAGRAEVDVVVATVLGSKVWLDGEPLQLDAQGRAVRRDVVDATASTPGQIEHSVRYRVEPPSGEVSVGELRTSIPMTGMQIDRPSPLLTTDRERVEIAGVVDKDAQLTIDGKRVSVIGGRFLHQYELPKQGEYQPRLVAMANGKAPRVAVLTLRRVDDLVQAAHGYNPDASLTYARIAQSPTLYRGQRVSFEGRVYNSKVEGGKTALQILVKQCPEGERCPLWVSYGTATEFTVNSWVKVLGTVDGEQQFRAETDEVKTVPKVEAAFLLPAEP
jgi:hypothetical protein